EIPRSCEFVWAGCYGPARLCQTVRSLPFDRICIKIEKRQPKSPAPCAAPRSRLPKGFRYDRNPGGLSNLDPIAGRVEDDVSFICRDVIVMNSVAVHEYAHSQSPDIASQIAGFDDKPVGNSGNPDRDLRERA